jgi:hypothetical protein
MLSFYDNLNSARIGYEKARISLSPLDQIILDGNLKLDTQQAGLPKPPTLCLKNSILNLAHFEPNISSQRSHGLGT